MLKIPDNILSRVQKPARYTGGEYNSIIKNHECINVRVALAFPDTYEIGMSNLGMRILYHVINSRNDTFAERVFAPWTDMEAEMRANDIPLYSLETKSPLIDFDIIGFSVGYELSFTNILNMLDLAHIPLLANNRSSEHPLVIAGGCCMYNPEPLSDFIDLAVIGEGEEIINEIIDLYKQHNDADCVDLLRKLAQIDGVYVPSLYNIEYNADNTIKSIKPLYDDVPLTVTKRFISDFNSSQYPDAPIMPYIETVHDRISLEIMRGCSRGCRFCQAGMVYRPVRQKSADKLKSLAKTLIDNTGYDEISLMSLSSSDYTGIDELVHDLTLEYEDRRIGLSLPSLRADAQCIGLAAEIQKVRKSGLTLAPEAGTQRLRDIINKNVTEENLFEAVEAAFSFGWKRIKLYFMIGLPDETDDDIIGIADLAMKVVQIGRRKGIRPIISVSVSNFVPKPHTPFQWRSQDSIEELERKQELLRKSIKDKRIDLSWHNAKTSRLEAILARGDRRLGKALLLAWESGCKMDAWQEHFDYDKWISAIHEAELESDFYVNRLREYSEILPWDHINSGIDKNFLIREDKCASAMQTTDDCRVSGKCINCGILHIVKDMKIPEDEVTDVPCLAKN